MVRQELYFIRELSSEHKINSELCCHLCLSICIYCYRTTHILVMSLHSQSCHVSLILAHMHHL